MERKNSDIRIAIADDDAVSRKMLRVLLEKEKYRVLGEATDGSEVLGLCASPPPDIIFLDIEMPKMSGLEALAEIRKLNRSIAVVMISGSSTPENVREAVSRGVQGFIVKPFTPEKVVAMINTVMDRKSQQNALKAKR